MMWGMSGRSLIVVLLLITSSRCACAADPPTDLAQRVRALLPATPGACVTAIAAGRTIFAQAYGLADVDGGAPCTLESRFRLASVSKQFTAACVLRLAEQGRLSLDDPLAKWFPEFPAYGAQATIRQLLTHTSGLPDYEELIPEGTTLQLDDADVLRLLMDAKEPKFPAGTQWSYSNSGYALLGLIVEQASATPLPQFMQRELFRPCGMDGAVMYMQGMNAVDQRVFGHERTPDGAGWVRADQSLTSAVRGDGGIYASAVEYGKWFAGLHGGKVLGKEQLAAMLSPQAATDRDGASYGYGWFLDKYRGRRRAYHNGGTRGFAHTVQTFPEQSAAVVVLLNGETAEPMTEVGEKVADLLLFSDENKLPK
jgi:CubicO group peptidase (beta-lactamase class C family)